MKRLTALFFFLISFNGIYGQEKLFSYSGTFKGTSTDVIVKATKIRLDRNVLLDLFNRKDANVRIEIPIENTTIVLNLKKAELFSKSFQVIESSTLKVVNYTPGYYLQGKIEGEENSFVAISLFKDFVGGVLSYKGFNYNIAEANNRNDHQTDDYVIYSDKDNKAPRPVCETEDDKEPQVFERNIPRTSFVGCPVDMYYETGKKIYESRGSIEGVMNYITILFNAKQTLYANEDILVQLREVLVWTTNELEYNMTTTTDALNSFRFRISNQGFNGDLAHYVTFTNLGGGRAALDGLCDTDDGGKCAVSGSLVVNYSNFPNYSFSVNVIAHEAGHGIGSRHTHNCTWPGGAIDNCYPTEGGCPSGPSPIGGGTIMSYCHLMSSVGINFANGFGPLPGDMIRSKVAAASASNCICDCNSIQMDVTTQDIGCGLTTGSATAVITGGNGPFTYEWSTGATTSSVSGLAAGTYYVKVRGSTVDCQVVKGFKILSSGTSTSVTLSPAELTVGKCLNDSYTITATVLPAATYTYQWFQNGNPMPGETNPTLTVTSTVSNSSTYYLVATGAACSGQSPAVTVNFQPVPVPVITSSGALNFCEGQSVTLTASSTTLSREWLRNGNVIPGATASTYTATQAGSYTVRHFTGTSCSAESDPVVVTTLPSPAAVISPATISFCEGNQGTITHNALPGETYTWLKNNVAISGETSATLNVTTSGSYQIRVKGTNGCESTSTSTVVTANPLPSALLSPANNAVLCDGGTLSLSAPALSTGTFSWMESGNPLSSTGNVLNVTAGGSYSVHILNTATGCESTSSVTVVTEAPAPTVSAGNDTTISIGQQVTLHASTTSTVPVDHYTWTPSTGLNDPSSPNPVATLTNDQEYTLTGYFTSGCTAEDKVLIKVLNNPALYIPSAFTPNGDSKNDILKVIGVGISSFNYFAVYNRFGQQLFYTRDINAGWDGTFKGKGSHVGTYVFMAEGTDYRGLPVKAKGTVLLIR